MPLYAHVHLEDPRGSVKYEPGKVVPDDLPGIDELLEHGSVGPSKPERNVITNSDGAVIREIDPEGISNRTNHIKRFNGDFTAKQIKDPKVDTPLAGVHTSEAQHREQEPHVYADEAGGQD